MINQSEKEEIIKQYCLKFPRFFGDHWTMKEEDFIITVHFTSDKGIDNPENKREVVLDLRDESGYRTVLFGKPSDWGETIEGARHHMVMAFDKSSLFVLDYANSEFAKARQTPQSDILKWNLATKEVLDIIGRKIK